MDDSLEAVTRQCSDQLMTYQRCLLLNPNEPSPACDVPKRSLQECASQAAPSLQRLRQLCAPKIRAYDSCLATHGHLPDDEFTAKCGPSLLELYRCTQKFKAEMEGGGEASRLKGEQFFTSAPAPAPASSGTGTTTK